MKKLILLLLVFTLGFVSANAQELKKNVTGIIYANEAGGFKWFYRLDLGEYGKYIIKEGDKKLKTNYSYAFPINLMKKNGWTYIDSFVQKDGTVYFIFEKKVNSDDEIKEGFELEIETEVVKK